LPELISPSQIGPGILLGRSVWTHLAPSPPGDPCTPRHHPGYAYPPLDPEAGLAWGCGERAHQESSSKHRRLSSARRTASPPTGYSFGPRSPDRLLAAGLGSRRLTLHPPFPLRNRGRSAVSPAPRREAAPFRRLTPFRRNGAGHPPAATLSSGTPWELGRVPAHPHPRSPVLNSVIEGSGILTRGWRLRLWAPFFVF
jgi:hypothetical protein